MIVSCPTCSTRYTLSDSSLGHDGRKVRCAKCGHIWWQRPEDPEAGATVTMSDAPTEIRPAPRAAKPAKSAKAKPAKAPRRPPAKSTVIGFAALALVLAGVGAGGYLERDLVVRTWPPAALFYDTIGLPVDPPGAGLELRNIRSEQKVENGTTLLVLDGEVANPTDGERPVPGLRATALDAARKPLQSWAMEPSAAMLEPGGVATFHHSQPNPGPVAEVTITFGPPPEAMKPAAGAGSDHPPERDKHPPETRAADGHAAPAKPAAAHSSGH